jgi:hypothetical protein
MDLWKTRDKSLKILATEYHPHAGIIIDIFITINQCVELFNKMANDNTYSSVCGLTLVKGRNIAIGMYSLILDNLAQEAGALLRVLIEYTELLSYFRLYPNGVNEAINHRLPSAGNIAKKIGGEFKTIRDVLNEKSAHSSFSYESMGHLINYKDSIIRVEHPFNKDILFENMKHFYVFSMLLAIEAIKAADLLSTDIANKQEIKLLELKSIGMHVFLINDTQNNNKQNISSD